MRLRTRTRSTVGRRRDHEPRPAAAPVPAPDPHDTHFDEQRARCEGGPDDRAQYDCSCGFTWQADVSASVACPCCGLAQAW